LEVKPNGKNRVLGAEGSRVQVKPEKPKEMRINDCGMKTGENNGE
jgi:hypothetical protein